MKTFILSIFLFIALPVFAQENRPLRAGDQAFNVVRDSARVTIMGREANGAYVIRFEEGPLVGQVGGGWGRGAFAVPYGCGLERICVRDQVINVDRDSVWTRVVGVQVDGRLVLQFLNGPLSGAKGANWQPRSLAIPRGCGLGNFCVGERVYNRDRNFDMCEVVGIQHDGRMVLKFLTGPIAGQQGGNWQPHSLVRIR
jgi:hypothetical protein